MEREKPANGLHQPRLVEMALPTRERASGSSIAKDRRDPAVGRMRCSAAANHGDVPASQESVYYRASRYCR